MRMLISALVFVTATAFAGEFVTQKFSMTIGGLGQNTSYYNCDSLEDMAEGHLENLGASSISVRCSGGLEDWGGRWQASPAFVRGSFDAPMATGTSTTTRTLKSRGSDQNCEANVAILDKVLPLFPAITVVSKKASCWNGRGQWSYQLSVAE